jgi:uncharacterized membrane protein YfcA
LTSYTLGEHALAALAGAGAGAVNAIAGGGTLISFPALVAIGVAKVPANVTNTVALCPGYFGGALAQRGELAKVSDRLPALAVAAGLGGLTGSILLLSTGEAVFTKVVPWLILLACGLLGGQNRIRALLKVGQREHGTDSPLGPRIAIYFAAIYGGYFGAGLSIMILAVLGIAFTDSLVRLNAIKQLLSLVINVVAAIFFATTGKVQWTLAAVMAPASLLGGLAGGKLVGVIKPRVLRAVVVTYGTVLAIYYLVR